MFMFSPSVCFFCSLSPSLSPSVLFVSMERTGEGEPGRDPVTDMNISISMVHSFMLPAGSQTFILLRFCFVVLYIVRRALARLLF